MKKLLAALALCLVLVSIIAVPAVAAQPTDNGFNEFGYNYNARLFNGTGESWSLAKELPADYLGIYANDKLVMKWNAEWDRGNDEGWNDPEGYDAWCTNEWNGSILNGSGESETVKIIWVGAELEDSTLWREGGYGIWGQFEVIMDKYVGQGEHEVLAHALSNGLGGIK